MVIMIMVKIKLAWGSQNVQYLEMGGSYQKDRETLVQYFDMQAATKVPADLMSLQYR